MYVFPAYKEIINTKQRMYVKAEAGFLDEISRLGTTNLLFLSTYNTLTMKVM